MSELPVEYFRVLAEQLVFVSAFLGGISATILGTFIVVKNDTKIFKYMILFSAVAAIFLIITVFGMTKVRMLLTPDAPFKNIKELLFYPRLVSGIAFYIGINALIAVIALSGWLRSKRLGIITTILGVLASIITFTLT